MDSTKHLDLRLLGQFLVVCDTLNMTVAAERLGMSVPAVSQLVVRLERDLGVTLFDRVRHGLRLAPAGALLRDRARMLLESEGAILDQLQGYRERLIPQLRLHVLSSLATILVPAIVAGFDDLVGKIQLRSGPSTTYVREFLSGELDLLITTEEMSGVPGIEQYLLCREQLIGIVPTSIPPDRRRPDALAGKLSFVRFARGQSRHQLAEGYLAGIGLDPPYDIECSSPEPIMELVTQGLAWTLAPPISVGNLKPSADKIAWMALSGPVPSRSIYLLARGGRYLDLPQQLAQRCRAALTAMLERWRSIPGNEDLVKTVQVGEATVTPLRSPRSVRAG